MMSMSSSRPHKGDPLAPHRGRLLGLAYRMLGSRSDAEDVVQDAYLRFAGATDVHNPEAFLVTIVTRLASAKMTEHGLRMPAEGNAAPSLPKIAELVAQGAVKPEVGATYPLAEAQKAHEQSETGHARGKIVLLVPGS